MRDLATVQAGSRHRLPGMSEAPLAGEPLSATFDGRFLLRNMVVDAAAGSGAPR